MSRRLRVAIVTPGSFPVPSGRSSSVEQVAMQIGEQLKERTEVTVIGKKTRRLPVRELRGGIRFIRPPVRPYAGQVARLLQRERPDIVQVENRPRHVRFVKRRLPDTPVVLSLHSTTYLSKTHISPASLRLCLQAADAIVVNSHFLRERVLAADETVARKIVVNHLGVDTNRFKSRWTIEERAKRESQLARLGLSGKKIILYVGRFIPLKGVHHLVSVMPTIAALQPDAVLLLVGGAYYGSNRPTAYVRRLHRLARPAGPHIRFVPFVPHEQIPDWFRLADVAVVPSVGQEAFGLVNVEAMASGVPVVAAASGGMGEIVEHGRSGLLASPGTIGEELVRYVCAVLENPEYARALGENGIRRVRDSFSWRHTAGRLLELYERLGAGDASGR